MREFTQLRGISCRCRYNGNKGGHYDGCCVCCSASHYAGRSACRFPVVHCAARYELCRAFRRACC